MSSSLDNANDGVRAAARAAIAAIIVANSGAILGALAQLDTILTFADGPTVARAFTAWGIGATTGLMLHVVNFLVASAFANGRKRSERALGVVATVTALGAIGCFAFGLAIVAAAMRAAG